MIGIYAKTFRIATLTDTPEMACEVSRNRAVARGRDAERWQPAGPSSPGDGRRRPAT